MPDAEKSDAGKPDEAEPRARRSLQRKSAGKTGALDLRSLRVTGVGYWGVGPLLPPPCSAILELYGESPCLGCEHDHRPCPA